MSQPPYPPPGNGYGFTLNTYGAQSNAPLLSSQPLQPSGSAGAGGGQLPLGAPYDPYGHLPPQQYYQQPPLQHQQNIRLPSVAQGNYALHQPPMRPPSAMQDPGVLGPSLLNGVNGPQRVPTPASYGLPSASGSASPAVSARAPPTPTMVGGVLGVAQQGGGNGGTGAGGSQSSPQQSSASGSQLPKARSAMACVLCRRQKMKCEGPEKAPCRRCRSAQVECVFEAPPVAPPRPRGNPGGVSEAWVEGRLSQVEERLSTLEGSSSQSQSLVQQQQQQSNALLNNSLMSDHERRIAALEAQLYALQLAASRPQPLPPQQSPPGALPTTYSSSSNGQGMQPLGTINGAYDYGNPGGSNLYDPATSAPQSLKHEGDGSELERTSREHHREKRFKGEPLPAIGGVLGMPVDCGVEADFISRGVITEEEATMCFESYHLTFAHSTISTAPPQPHLSFNETRSRSPLYLATVISIGARSLSRFDTFHATYGEAMRLARLTFLPYAHGGGEDDLTQLDPSSPVSAFTRFIPFGAPGSDAADAPKPRLSTLSLKALMLLALYHSMPELLVHVYMLGYRFVLPTALLGFDKLSEEEKLSPAGRGMINQGRVFLTGYLWLALYSYVRGQHGSFDQPMDVLRSHLETIRRSVYAEMPTDHVLRVNLEECFILLDAFKSLGPGMRTQQLSKDNHEEIYRVVGESIERLVEWDRTWHEHMDILSQWGDSQELKSQVPFAHGRMALALYIFRDIPAADIDRNDPRVREFARMGVESSLVILRWGVESRIWMPFSVTGGYVLHINLPTSIFLLNACAHLYPEDIDFAALRPLLHRLAKQCDVTISHAGTTPREIARAKRTKMEVLQLDRFAFEQAGDDFTAALAPPFSAPGAGAPLGGGGGGDGDDAGLFGHEITASLESLRLELNLWSRPLMAHEDDL